MFAYPRVQIARLLEQGAAVRLAHGYAVAVPDDQGPDWRPTIEEAAVGIAATIFGQRHVVLLWVTAARIHHAIPRALGNSVVAVPHQHRPIALAGGGRVLFVTRATERLAARLETLETGRVLVTTPVGAAGRGPRVARCPRSHRDTPLRQALYEVSRCVVGLASHGHG